MKGRFKKSNMQKEITANPKYDDMMVGFITLGNKDPAMP